MPGHPRWRRHRRAADRPGQSVSTPAGDLGDGRIAAAAPHIDGLGFKPAKPFGDVFDFDIEGANVGYKWMAAKGLTPTFAFGHGLSYTSFAYENLKVSVEGSPGRQRRYPQYRQARQCRRGTAVPEAAGRQHHADPPDRLLTGEPAAGRTAPHPHRSRAEALAHYDAQARSGRSTAAPTRCSCRACRAAADGGRAAGGGAALILRVVDA